MKEKTENSFYKISIRKITRRKFLQTASLSSAGIIFAPYLNINNSFSTKAKENFTYSTKVAITKADNYERSFVKDKTQYLFNLIDGITDTIKPGNKVAIKINLTGGASSVPYNMWTHPEVLRAVGELVIDCGVNPSDIFIVEALWSIDAYNNYGYRDVQNSLGAILVDLNKPDPYPSFYQKAVGSNSFNFSSFSVNQILQDVNVYISIPKMKQHYEAGVTCSLKNQVGIVPKDSYTITNDSGRRGAIHHNSSYDPSNSYLPRSICDLNMARPVNLAVIDGVMNARGGEGTWNPTFQTVEDHVLLAGKDPVATDSIAAFLLGNDPEAPTFQLPAGGQCDNHLYLMNQLGIGTNKLNEIEIVGDGSDLVTSVETENNYFLPNDIQLAQNYPNPFNPVTNIGFSLPKESFVQLIIYNSLGEKIVELVSRKMDAGNYNVSWDAGNMASGTYFYQLIVNNQSLTKKLILLK